MNPKSDPATTLLLAILIILFAFLLLIGLAIKITQLYRELKYINLEIGRTTGEEQKYWKQEKRRLWLSLLPFHGR